MSFHKSLAVLALVLALVLVGSPALSALADTVIGDLNGDGKVTISDMLMVKSSVLGGNLAATAAAAGDLNRDGNQGADQKQLQTAVSVGKQSQPCAEAGQGEQGQNIGKQGK
mgnify:CR=1 FL=1